MRQAARILRCFAREVLPVLMVLVLVLRVMAAPLIMPVMVDGRISLCLGGQIVQVAFDPANPSAPELSSDTCPILDITAALDVENVRLPVLVGRAVASIVVLHLRSAAAQVLRYLSHPGR